MKLDCRGRVLDLSSPAVMGILNVTPDSFSDGGQYTSLVEALRRAHDMVEEGAAIIDVGGESTRPGAVSISARAEIERVVPVVSALAREIAIPISVDTQKPEVMRAAVAAGASFINDVNALRSPGAIEAARELKVPVCLMHMRGDPHNMQKAPEYTDVTREVVAFLKEQVASCIRGGISRDRLIVDPGFGFGKTLEHNVALLRDLQQFGELGLPVLVGTSRKTMLGTILGGVAPEARVFGGIALSVLAAQRGARLIRTHDVRATVDALRVVEAVGAAKSVN